MQDPSAGTAPRHLKAVPFTDIRIADAFWAPRLETNRTVTVWYDFKRCEETGRIDNFSKAGGLMKGEFKGIPFDDSDVYKVIEGAAYSLALQPDSKLDPYLDGLIAKIAAAQEPDGYLYTARTIAPQGRVKFFGPARWSNLGTSHELYNAGHLYEAAVAHFRATGKKSLLNVAIKNADMLCHTFGPGKVQEPPGHQEIEIGLCKLYLATGARRYLDLAKYYIGIRGRADTHKLRGPYQQDHKPILEQDEAVGHAVRAGYFYSGVADVAALTGDGQLIGAIDRLWENVVARKLYLTGGIGARHSGEAFGDNYELPNASAYNETCAAIANALWNHRMFLLHGDAKYLDVLERVLYNGFLSGVSLSGNEFFYPNPLASNGGYKRSPWFDCACCPVNVARFLPSLAGYVYATRGDEAFVNLFIAGSGTAKLAHNTVTFTQETRYPWDGHVKITVAPQEDGPFALRVRIPGWARNQPVPSDLYRYADGAAEPPVLTVNGRTWPLEVQSGFARIERSWKRGDAVELDLPMPVRQVAAHEAVKDDVGLAALERGPLVYCVEGADNGGCVTHFVLPGDARLTPEQRPDLLGGITLLRGEVPSAFRDASGALHTQPVTMTAIPYYAWCHRGANPMAVWLPRSVERAQSLACPARGQP